MAITARVTAGVQAIWVVIAEHGRTIRAIVPREALESRWDVGPDQHDLLRAFDAHQDEIETEVRHQSRTARSEPFVVKDLTTATSRRQRRSAATSADRAAAW